MQKHRCVPVENFSSKIYSPQRERTIKINGTYSSRSNRINITTRNEHPEVEGAMRILSTETNIFRWCSFISKFILLENKSHPFMWFACSLLMHLFILTVVIWHVLWMCMCVCAFAFACAHTLGILDLNFSMHCCGLFDVFHFFSFFFSKWEREKKTYHRIWL